MKITMNKIATKTTLHTLAMGALSASLLVGTAVAQQVVETAPAVTETVEEAAVGKPLPTSVKKVALNDIAGVWKSYGDVDEKGKKEAKALIRISETDGVYKAVIHQPLTEEGKTEICTKCTGVQKGKPYKGLTIMNGVKYNAEKKRWDGGQILDPQKGKEYRVSLKLLDGGKKLEVTGHVLMFSRSQVWTRAK